VQEVESAGFDLRDDEFRGVTTRDNMKDMAEYDISVRYTDELVYTDEEIRIEVFGKTSSTILLNSQLSMRDRRRTETFGR
jgi:hypothetical protein